MSTRSLERDWPLFGLWIKTPRVTLGYPMDDDLEVLNTVISRGIHDPAVMPFTIPWTDDPLHVGARNSLQFWWGLRAAWKPTKWALTMVVKEGDRVLGVQDLSATNFAVTRQVATGSWLGKTEQGRGIGKEMRAAILHLAFAGLGAERATSGAFEDNPASLAVSRALAYVETGDDLVERRGQRARHLRLLLQRSIWERNRRDDIEIHGLDACLPMFGLDKKSA
jgi:RimJ/RimL family protein N-acetyltransferase